MTGQQHAVMWMGLLLIILRMFTTVQWTELKSVFAMGAGSSATSGSSGGSPSLPGSIIGGILGGPALPFLPGLISDVVPGATPSVAGKHG